MKFNFRFGWPVFMTLAAAVALLGFAGQPAQAGPITGPWTNATGQGDGPIHDANTNHPIVGDLVDDSSTNSNAADAEMFDSPFPAITLDSSGDKIFFTGMVRLSGTVNSPATSGTPRTQFRFGLFDGDEVGPDDNGWVGYYMSNKHGNPGTPSGVLARKPVGNTSAYLSVTGQNVLASVQGDGTAASLFNDDTYSMMIEIERIVNDLKITATLTGANGFSQTLSALDTTASTLGTYTFDHVGFLLGNGLDTDRAAFSKLTVFIPEPASWLMGLGALIGGVFARRRYC
jgi:hypothetical protein